jgi:hypothetical protein
MKGGAEKTIAAIPLVAALVERGAKVSVIENDVDWRELPGEPTHLGIVGNLTDGMIADLIEHIEHKAHKSHLVVDLGGAMRLWVSYISTLPTSPPIHTHQQDQLARKLVRQLSLGSVAFRTSFFTDGGQPFTLPQAQPRTRLNPIRPAEAFKNPRLFGLAYSNR